MESITGWELYKRISLVTLENYHNESRNYFKSEKGEQQMLQYFLENAFKYFLVALIVEANSLKAPPRNNKNLL